MDNNVKSNTNFWTEISNYNIHVPYYQRDYAQGRCDGGRIDNIREVFVYELYQAITKREKTCHLGLVFGSYDIAKKSFIAVDGQQRLTTVFLLHWYVAWREGNLSDYEKTLKNFSWDTRSYSSQFVALLFNIKLSNNVIEAIKTNCNYFSIWGNDPTVKGMLTMLEEIERQYPKNEDGLCQKLFSDDCNIRYDILKLEKNSDGKTYLKMNSRGRSLTTFELFKSKFIDNYKPSFAENFDTSWLHFMLSMSKNENGDFADPDISYMNFINEYTYLILKSKDITDSDTYKEFIAAKLKGDLIDVPFISFEKYNPAFVGNIDCFSNFFDWIVVNYGKIKGIDENLAFKSEKKEWEFFLDKIIISHNPTFSHRAKFLSLFKYANLTNYDVLNEELFRKWNRVFRNLIENSDIDAANFGDVCETVNVINNSDIYLYLSSGGGLSTLNEKQVNEEIAKAKQIEVPRYDGKSWEHIINEAESYAFFKGAIRFLFTKETIGDDWDDFDMKWENAQKYFDDNGVKDKTLYKTNALLMKSLLANGNWNNIWWHFEFSNDKVRWKRILTSDNWKIAVDAIMSKEVTNETTNSVVNTIEDPHIKSIVDDGLMDYVCNENSGARIRGTYHGYHAIWQSGYPKYQIVLNPILSELYHSGKIEYCGEYEIKNCRYYQCKDKNVNFKYNNHHFQWWGEPDENALDVYLLKENEDYCMKNQALDEAPDEDKYFCFRVTEDMSTKDFLKKLECLIQQACAEKAGKDCYNDCSNKEDNNLQS